MFTSHTQHAARACRGVVQAAHHAGFGQRLIIFNEQQVDHQADDLTRGEVFTRRFIGQLGKLANQLFKNGTHFGVVDPVGVQVDGGELLGDHVQQAGLGQLVDLGVELEALEDVAHRRAEGLQVGTQVFADVVLVTHELFQVQGGGVVEELAGLTQQKWFGVQTGFFTQSLFSQHLGLGRLQHAVQTAQYGEGQDDLAVLGLLEITAQQVSDRPDKRREIWILGGHVVVLVREELPRLLAM